MMNSDKKITIIRHGETYWNIERKLQGQANSDLTDKGLYQTKLLAKYLQHQHYDYIFSSDLKRCRVTAEKINTFHSKEIIFNNNLRERDFGDLQGLTKDDIKHIHKDIYEKYINGNLNFKVSNGESFEKFYQRSIDCIQQISDNYNGSSFLIIGHGGILDCVIRKTMGLALDAPRCFSIYNTSINKFVISGDKWKLDSWGELAHLNSLDSIDDF